MMAGPREKPPEDAVRDELREHDEHSEAETPVAEEDSQAEAPDDGDADDDESSGGAQADSGAAGDGDEGSGEDESRDEDGGSAEDQGPDEGGSSAGEDRSEDPGDELGAVRRERDEYLALAQRTQADFENWRKRAAREAAAAGQRARSGLVGELLPVVDNLERALDSATEADEHLAGGVRLVHSELTAVLSRNGVEPFDPAGERFDPAEHEALSTREQDGTDAGTVLDVVEKGYRLNGTVLRPARVVVSG